jgi:glycosyltransferase involved in cell wall biosynthesis
MNVLILDQFSDPGGAQQAMLDLLPGFAERGWNVTVALPGNGALFDLVRSAGFPAEPMAFGPYTSGRKSAADLARFLADAPPLAEAMACLAKRTQAQLVYLNGPRLLPAAALAGLRPPVLFHAHSYLAPGMTRRLAGAALGHLRARVVGSCRFVAEHWRRYAEVSVVYNGVAGPAAESIRRPGPPRIGCIGRIAPEKGQLEFLAAAARIDSEIPDCEFVICGAPLFGDPAGERYDAEVRAAAAGLPVRFTGWVDDVYAALAGLDLLQCHQPVTKPPLG